MCVCEGFHRPHIAEPSPPLQAWAVVQGATPRTVVSPQAITYRKQSGMTDMRVFSALSTHGTAERPAGPPYSTLPLFVTVRVFTVTVL